MKLAVIGPAVIVVMPVTAVLGVTRWGRYGEKGKLIENGMFPVGGRQKLPSACAC